MIDIIRRLDPVVDLDHAADQADHIGLGDRAVRDGDVQIEFLIQLVATHTLEIVMALVEELLFEELAGIIQRGRIAGTHLLEELDQGGFGDGQIAGEIPFGFLLERGSDEQAVGVVVDILEEGQNFLVGAGLDSGDSFNPSSTAARARRKTVIGTVRLRLNFRMM